LFIFCSSPSDISNFKADSKLGWRDVDYIIEAVTASMGDNTEEATILLLFFPASNGIGGWVGTTVIM
jgi:hypothetical protein